MLCPPPPLQGPYCLDWEHRSREVKETLSCFRYGVSAHTCPCQNTRGGWCDQHHIWTPFFLQLQKKPGRSFSNQITGAPSGGDSNHQPSLRQISALITSPLRFTALLKSGLAKKSPELLLVRHSGLCNTTDQTHRHYYHCSHVRGLLREVEFCWTYGNMGAEKKAIVEKSWDRNDVQASTRMNGHKNECRRYSNRRRNRIRDEKLIFFFS